MKIRCAFKVKVADEIVEGRHFWLMGTFENPMAGTIYDKEKDAVEFSETQAKALKELYADRLFFVD